MNYEQAITELSTYKHLISEIENFSELISRIESTSELKAIRYDSERIESNTNGADISNNLARVETIRAMYDKQVNDKLMCMQEVDSKISSINNSSFRNILRMKYIQDFKLEYIAMKLNISFRHVRRLHKKAVYAYVEVLKRYSMSSNVL